MIVDVHTHIGEPHHYFGEFRADTRRAWGDSVRLGRTLDEHWTEAAAPVDRCLVLAFNAPAAGYVAPNEYIAEYVARHPEKLIGFASVDPGHPDAIRELRRAPGLGLRGLKLAPIYQGTDPLGADSLAVVEVAAELGLPILWHMGTTFYRDGDLAHARPELIDAIARRFPELRIVIAHLGHPWIDTTLVVIRKHPHVYADVSALSSRPWQLYTALVAAAEYRVTDKLLFGTDYPFDTFESATRALRGVNRFTGGTDLPRIAHEAIEGIINRDTLALLGIADT